jgi:cobaltochelatase CobN
VTVPKLNGAIEPLVIGWRKQEANEGLDLPIEERMEKLGQRVANWTRLRRLSNAEKRVAIVHYNVGASYLDVPKSLFQLLRALRERGYSVEVPPSEEDLLSRLAEAKNVSAGDDTALRRLAAAPSTAKIPVAEYLKWFRGLPEELQREVIRWWGEPPGKSMVWKGHLLIPQVPLGNVTLVALPSRGESDNPEALYHDLAVPPPHHYIAFYLWLRRGFKADAILHFGTHGTHEFLPRKQQGLSATDWPDLLVQDMPNIYPYMCVNAVEAITAKRRGYAVMVSHMVPPLRATGLSLALEELHRLLRGYERAEGEPLREEYRRQILAQVKGTAAVGVEIKDTSDFDQLAQSAHLLLHRLQEEEAPIGLHVLGEQPEGADLVSTVLPMLHGELEKALAGRAGEPGSGGTREQGSKGAREQNGECERRERDVALQLLDGVLRQGLSAEEAQAKVLGRVEGRGATPPGSRLCPADSGER